MVSCTPMCAQPATRSTRASRRSLTPADAWLASRSGTPRRRPPKPSSDRNAGRQEHILPYPAFCMSGRSEADREEGGSAVFEAADHLRSEFAELEVSLADPEVHADLSRARRIGRRYAELSPLISALDEHDRLSEDLAAARELSADDQGFA